MSIGYKQCVLIVCLSVFCGAEVCANERETLPDAPRTSTGAEGSGASAHARSGLAEFEINGERMICGLGCGAGIVVVGGLGVGVGVVHGVILTAALLPWALLGDFGSAFDANNPAPNYTFGLIDVFFPVATVGSAVVFGIVGGALGAWVGAVPAQSISFEAHE